MSKENIFKLTAHAGEFVFQNKSAFKERLVILFPLFLVMALINHVATFYHEDRIVYLTGLPFLYIISCFSLAWHRVSLRGVDEPVRNPFVWEKGDGKFHAMFIGIMLLVLGFSSASEQATLYLEKSPNQVLVVIGSMASLIVLCAVLYYSVRLMFFLPAKSVGVTLSYEDIKRASKGSMLRFVFSTLLTSVTFILVMSIYLLIVTVVLQASGASGEQTSLSSAFIAFFLSIPLYLSAFFYWAVNVTILSRLYNWGMQNNA